jgi:hypothetical protein
MYYETWTARKYKQEPTLALPQVLSRPKTRAHEQLEQIEQSIKIAEAPIRS